MAEQEQTPLAPKESRRGLAFTGNPLVDGATLLGLATGYGYLMVYFYERGLCSHFGIPALLIEVNPIKLVWVPAGAAILYMVILVFLDLFNPLLSRVKVGQTIRPVLVWFAFMLVLGGIASWAHGHWFYLSLFVALVAGGLLTPFLMRRPGLSYAERLADLDLLDLRIDKLSDKLDRKIGYRTVLILILLYFTVYVSRSIGIGVARHQSEFSIVRHEGVLTEEPNEYLLLTSYGDNLVTRKFVVPDSLRAEVRLFTIEELAGSGWILEQAIIEKLFIDTLVAVTVPASSGPTLIERDAASGDSCASLPQTGADSSGGEGLQ